MKKRAFLSCIVMIMMLFYGGCRIMKIEEAPRRNLEYTVVSPEDIPVEIQQLVQERKEREFQLIFQSGDTLYLVKGYGRQMSGGYSIAVEELSMSENAVFFDTKLIGPEDDSLTGIPSYPYIVVKTAYLDKTVEFR